METTDFNTQTHTRYFFVQREGDADLPLGPYIGDLTDEIADKYGQNSHISKMVAAGPKNYAFQVETSNGPETIVKLKGIQQNAKPFSIVNMETMTEMVHQFVDGNTNISGNVPQFRIQANKDSHEVRSFDFNIIYRCVSEKRRVCGNATVTVRIRWEVSLLI